MSQADENEMPGQPILRAADLRKRFTTKGGLFDGKRSVDAVRGVSLELHRGRTLGLAGESGSGKSTVARLLVRIVDPDDGTVTFKGQYMGAMKQRELRRARGRMPMVFQDPYASLDPTKMILDIVAEPLVVHQRGRPDREEAVVAQLERVGLDPAHRHRYPYEFSGGQRQRIAIARALINDPDLVLADEPVSALDVSTQAQVLNLLDDLRRERDLAMLVVSHDLSVLRQVCDEMAIMFKGRIVEQGPVEAVFGSPAHPYTQELLDAVPRVRARTATTVRPETRPVDDEIRLADDGGCAYRHRCAWAIDACAEIDPALEPTAAGTEAACIRHQDVVATSPQSIRPQSPR